MDRRSAQLLIAGIFGLVAVNLAFAWYRNSLDYTAVTVSLVGLMGVIHGVTKRDPPP
jgi:hypothetical protein